ncbi:MAG: RluA family pseudouridine synthase [Bacteroidota bacterium]|nr:RluA family pseudouridine synthase [Bacteroidota bacterium]MDX5430568.1 RluA family pseudouridine synthase [Bacteroidota bacterium]MDX5469320.1 RluA family pseudouridine synthase [Bacteroidota bacterium]
MEEERDILQETEDQELYEHYRILVDKGQSLLRIDKFLMHRIENASRTKIQNAAEEGCILVNDKAVKSNYKVKPNDVISVVLPNPPRDTTVYPEDIPLDILYEDDDLLIVNKEAGMVVHPGFNNYTGTLVNALVHHFDHLPVSRNGEQRPGLVHRIDKDTSGLLVISKNEKAMTHLAKQFFDHSIERSYLALVWGDFEEEEGTIEGNLDRNPKDRLQMMVFQDPEKGKPAITHWKVIERFHYATLVECRLETGRTHQIRAHMRYIGHPLFNDRTYGGDQIVKGVQLPKFKQFIQNQFDILPRQALHAKSLGFIHPRTGEKIYFDSELPEDFQTCLDKWRGVSAAWNLTGE